MRTATHVLQELRDWALGWDNVRAVVLNGSRADPIRPPDDLSDYDVAIFVQDLESIRDGRWLEAFGEVLVRWPMRPQQTADSGWITQLALFTDGVRIDFQFAGAKTGLRTERAGAFFCVLIDKDGVVDMLVQEPPPGHGIRPPTASEFADRINAFWWDAPYVAKALRRGELDFAKFMLDSNIRFKKLHPLLRWYIGTRHGWEADVGIHGRFFSHRLDESVWERYLETFAGADIEDNWRALFAMLSFVNTLGQEVARELQFSYPENMARNVTEYIRRIAPREVQSD